MFLLVRRHRRCGKTRGWRSIAISDAITQEWQEEERQSTLDTGGRIRNREFHTAFSTWDKSLRDLRQEMAWPLHVSPYSTFIAAMGNYWREGCFEAVRGMQDYARDRGIRTSLVEMPDRCYQPYDALGTMRNYAYMRAINEGYEYILYVDNDVKPKPSILMDLLNRHVPIIAPVISYADGKDWGLGTPKVKRGQGLAMVGNLILSMVLFETRVFLPYTNVPFWADAIGADEGYHFLRLQMQGAKPFLDTDVEVLCVDPPHFPLDKTLHSRTKDNLDSWRSSLAKSPEQFMKEGDFVPTESGILIPEKT